ncbi:MAG: sigma 54-interacting transcriptional regulator [Magnetococcales bacterium]|nr:sigma 54-interacting transcriptional regulator [Magnetococcales bacterium]
MPASSQRSSPSQQAIDLLHSIHDPAILLDLNYQILAANRAYREDHGGERDLSGLHCYEVSHDFNRPCDLAGECCPLRVSAETKNSERMLHIHQSVSGQEFVDVEIRPILDRQGEIAYFLEVLRPTLIASATPNPIGLVGQAPAFNQMLELVQRVAPESTTVLLLGESGVGKELIARAVHEASNRVNRSFVPVECSGLAENLFESELFGHKKGSFTGAHNDKPGLVEAAHEGTLFLDEIGEVSAQIQVKLLRLLETQTYRRVGSTESRYVDFRLVCATNRPLADMVAQGTFRKDLYYRISAFPITLPPLRNRVEDIGLLAQSLLKRISADHPYTLSAEALRTLESYPFPGNIRELQNLLERARILSSSPLLLPEHFPELLVPDHSPNRNDFDKTAVPGTMPPFQITDILPLKSLEQTYLLHLLNHFSGQRSDLAKQLSISQRTLARKIQEIRSQKKAKSGRFSE